MIDILEQVMKDIGYCDLCNAALTDLDDIYLFEMRKYAIPREATDQPIALVYYGFHKICIESDITGFLRLMSADTDE